MKRRTQRANKRDSRRQAREHAQHNPSGNSVYGRKHAFLIRNGGSGLDYPDKPWR